MGNLMERPLRQLIGIAAIVGPGLHLLSDVLEWVGGGFSPVQLWVNYVAFLLMPFLMVGLYAVQRPQAGWGVLWGALLYGAAFIYFTFTTLYALSEHLPDYAALWQKLGPVYTLHGGLMVVGGALFGVASWKLEILPRGALLAFLAGLLLNLLFSLLPVPELWQTIGSTLRNVGLIGIGATLLTGGDRWPLR
jgi:hypothetical protein